MKILKTLSAERIAEIKAFQDTDISDCPELTDAELAEFKPKHPEFFRVPERTIQVTLDKDVFDWIQSLGAEYQSYINTALRREIGHKAPASV
jgi:uncharacterized protein (DUF4415 family)